MILWLPGGHSSTQLESSVESDLVLLQELKWEVDPYINGTRVIRVIRTMIESWTRFYERLEGPSPSGITKDGRKDGQKAQSRRIRIKGGEHCREGTAVVEA